MTKYDVRKTPTTGRWFALKTSKGLLTKKEAERVCQIKNGKNVPGPNVMELKWDGETDPLML